MQCILAMVLCYCYTLFFMDQGNEHTHTHTGIPPQPYPPWSPTHAARHKKTPDNASRRFSQLALQCDAECSVGCCEVRTQYCCITNACPTNPAFGSTVPQAEKHSVCLCLSLSLSFSPVCVWWSLFLELSCSFLLSFTLKCHEGICGGGWATLGSFSQGAFCESTEEYIVGWWCVLIELHMGKCVCVCVCVCMGVREVIRRQVFAHILSGSLFNIEPPSTSLGFCFFCLFHFSEFCFFIFNLSPYSITWVWFPLCGTVTAWSSSRFSWWYVAF